LADRTDLLRSHGHPFDHHDPRAPEGRLRSRRASIVRILTEGALPDSLRDHRVTLARLAAAYKQINAPLGKLGFRTLTGISTQALKGDHAAYAVLEDKIVDLTKRRNEIALKMITTLENASFRGREIHEEEAEHLIEQAEDLLESIE
jgi:hypothetical protein